MNPKDGDSQQSVHAGRAADHVYHPHSGMVSNRAVDKALDGVNKRLDDIVVRLTRIETNSTTMLN